MSYLLQLLFFILVSRIMCDVQYTYLLTSQLESQRLYFEEKMENVERQSQRQVRIIPPHELSRFLFYTFPLIYYYAAYLKYNFLTDKYVI